MCVCVCVCVYGVVWCGMVWNGVVWHGKVWCGKVWYGVVSILGVYILCENLGMYVLPVCLFDHDKNFSLR